MAKTSTQAQPQKARPSVRKAKRPNRLARLWLRERQRRAAADAKPGTRGVRMALGGLGLVGVLGLTVWLGGFADPSTFASSQALRQSLASAGFQVEHVEVRGARRAEAGEVADALALTPGALIFDVDLQDAKARIETLGWVDHAAVLRRLPNRLVIVIDERQPLALWDSPEGTVVLDASGVPISGADPVAYDGLPRLEGDAAPEAAGELVQAISRYPALVRRVGAFERVGGRRWDMTLKNGLLVMLPEGQVGAALDQLAALEASEGVLELPLDVIDLRSAALVLRPRDLPASSYERGV